MTQYVLLTSALRTHLWRSKELNAPLFVFLSLGEAKHPLNANVCFRHLSLLLILGKGKEAAVNVFRARDLLSEGTAAPFSRQDKKKKMESGKRHICTFVQKMEAIGAHCNDSLARTKAVDGQKKVAFRATEIGYVSLSVLPPPLDNDLLQR